MIFRGISATFSTIGAKQYNTIGSFWDYMSNIYGMENLRGLGYNWTETTIEYAIGLENNDKIDLDIMKLTQIGINASYKEISIPLQGWERFNGKTDDLPKIYEKIYLNGKLEYEIERFTNDGNCTIDIIRK